MKRVFETAECEAVRNSIFLVQSYEKHENQMKGCAVELQMNAWTSLACDTVKCRRGMVPMNETSKAEKLVFLAEEFLGP